VGDGALPRTRIDLTNGTAHIVLPGEDGALGAPSGGRRPPYGRPGGSLPVTPSRVPVPSRTSGASRGRASAPGVSSSWPR
jgi:hypothetical protein